MLAYGEEWIKGLAGKLKNDEEYQKKAVGFDTTFQFIVRADTEKGVPEDRACGLSLPDCNDVWVGVRDRTTYTMTGSYKVFFDLLTGKLGAVTAITTRKVRLKGNMANLLRFSGAINRFVDVLREVPTDFEGDYS